MRTATLCLALSLLSALHAQEPASAGTIADLAPQPLPTAAPTPQMSQYGWVGAWNWGFGAMLSPSTVFERELNYSYYYPNYHYTDKIRQVNQWAAAVHLSAEKVLSTSFASRLELDYGYSSQDRTINESLDDVTTTPATHYDFPPYHVASNLNAIGIGWGLRANSSPGWVPQNGWGWFYGPNGKSLRPALDIEVHQTLSIASTSVNAYGSSISFSYWPHVSGDLSLPVLNGLDLSLGYSNSIRRVSSGSGMDPIQAARAAFQRFDPPESLSAGLTLYWPRFGHPDLLQEANPDGRPFYPSLSYRYETIGDDYIDAECQLWTLKLPISPRSTLFFAAENYRLTHSASPVVPRFSFVWKLYGAPPKPTAEP